MMNSAKGKLKKIEISAVIKRKDGTVEDLGVVSYWHKNPVMRLIAKTGMGIRGTAAPVVSRS